MLTTVTVTLLAALESCVQLGDARPGQEWGELGGTVPNCPKGMMTEMSSMVDTAERGCRGEVGWEVWEKPGRGSWVGVVMGMEEEGTWPLMLS